MNQFDGGKLKGFCVGDEVVIGSGKFVSATGGNGAFGRNGGGAGGGGVLLVSLDGTGGKVGSSIG